MVKFNKSVEKLKQTYMRLRPFSIVLISDIVSNLSTPNHLQKSVPLPDEVKSTRLKRDRGGMPNLIFPSFQTA